MGRAVTAFLEEVYYPAVKYRVHISLLFFFLVLTTFEQVLKRPVVWPVALAFSAWHLALYVFDRAWDFDKDAVSQPQEAIRPDERRFWLTASFVLAALPLAVLPATGHSVLPYLPFLPLTFLYTYPVFGKTRAKDVLLVKNLYSALLVWSLPLAVIAWAYGGRDLDFWPLFRQTFLGMFVYVMVGEAFWDIRDIEGDRRAGVRTIPVVFGLGATKVYLLALVVADAAVFGRPVGDSAVVYTVLILLVGPTTPNWVYHLPPLLALYRFLKPVVAGLWPSSAA